MPENQQASCESCKAIMAQTPAAADVFAMIPDDASQTMTLYPTDESKTSIKLTKKTARILIAILDRQLQEWL